MKNLYLEGPRNTAFHIDEQVAFWTLSIDESRCVDFEHDWHHVPVTLMQLKKLHGKYTV
jgi:hypothetical protein